MGERMFPNHCYVLPIFVFLQIHSTGPQALMADGLPYTLYLPPYALLFCFLVSLPYLHSPFRKTNRHPQTKAINKKPFYMKTIIVSVGVWMAISLLSCQKQLSFPAVPPVTDSLPADTLPVFQLTDILEYNYDAAGVTIADSSHTNFLYDTVASTVTMTYRRWDAVNGNDNSKHVFTYDANDNWMKDDEYDKSNYSQIKYSNRFTRSGDEAQRYDYSKDDYMGNPRPFTAFFQHTSLAGGVHETKVVDTSFLDYTYYTYYKAQQDASGKLIKRQYIPWRQNQYHDIEEYTYNAAGQIQKVVDSNYLDAAIAVYVTTTVYEQEPEITDAIEVFTRQIKGRNFDWYMQGKSYDFNLLYDNYYTGAPLRSFTATEHYFENGALMRTRINAYTINNVIDLDNNLKEALISINGKTDRKFHFTYKRIK
jgi:hypothetical protein